MKIVEVLWLDAWGDENSHTASDIETEHGPYEQRSVGYLVKDDAAGVTIAGCANESFERVLFVPRGMIKRVRNLK